MQLIIFTHFIYFLSLSLLYNTVLVLTHYDIFVNKLLTIFVCIYKRSFVYVCSIYIVISNYLTTCGELAHCVLYNKDKERK